MWVPWEYTLHRGPVDLQDFPPLELPLQSALGALVLCDRDHARRKAVESVHDPGPEVTWYVREWPEAVQQRVYQSPGPNARPSVHNHACGLIDDRDVVILEHDLEFDVLRLSSQGRRLDWLSIDGLACAHPAGWRPNCISVDPDVALPDPPDDGGAARVSGVVADKAVQARARRRCRNCQAHRVQVCTAAGNGRQSLAARDGSGSNAPSPRGNLPSRRASRSHAEHVYWDQVRFRIPAWWTNLLRLRSCCVEACRSSLHWVGVSASPSDGPVHVLTVAHQPTLSRWLRRILVGLPAEPSISEPDDLEPVLVLPVSVADV